MNNTLLFVFCGQIGTGSVTTPTIQPWLPVTYRLFGPMKKMEGGQKFASDTEVQSTVRQWLGQQPASFSASGI